MFCKFISLHFVLTYVAIFTTYLFLICNPDQTRTDTSPGIHHIKLGPCYLHHRVMLPVFPSCQRSIRNKEVSAPIPFVVRTGIEPV
jgi:hypothetical protein